MSERDPSSGSQPPEWRVSTVQLVRLPALAEGEERLAVDDRVLLERLVNNAHLTATNQRPRTREEAHRFAVSDDGMLLGLSYAIEARDGRGEIVVQHIFAPSRRDAFTAVRDLARASLPRSLSRDLPTWKEFSPDVVPPPLTQVARSRWSIAAIFGRSQTPNEVPTGPSPEQIARQREEHDEGQLQILMAQLEPLFPQLMENVRALAAGREKAVSLQELRLPAPNFGADQQVEIRVNGRQAWLVLRPSALTGGREVALRILAAPHKIEEYFAVRGERIRLEKQGPLAGLSLNYSQAEQASIVVDPDFESVVTLRAGERVPDGTKVVRMPERREGGGSASFLTLASVGS